jgi:hypothetical protein
MKKQFLILAAFLMVGLAAFAQVPSADGTFSASLGTPNPNLVLRTAGTVPRLTILTNGVSAGFVGIGTTAPAYHLDLQSSASTTLRVTSNSTNPAVIETYTGGAGGPNGFFESALPSAITRYVRLGSRGSTDLALATNNINRMLIDVNGKVGINTLTPAYQLDVNGIINATDLYVKGTLFKTSQWTTAASDIYFNTGNVGVGITAPEAKLHIKDGNLLIDNSLNGGNPSIYLGTGTTELNRYLQLANSPGLLNSSGLKAGGVLVADTYSYANPSKNDLIVKGKVGIGTTLLTNPNNYTLAVNGKIGAKDVQVETSSTTWPDYVFTQDYRLPSLAEVEKFIQENNHLESVPSATEIEKDGHSLGEMDKILLKKVEELTLYVIQQQKEIEELKKKIEKKN